MDLADLAWPFLGLTDEHGRDVGWCELVGPVRDEPELRRLEALARVRRLVGFTAFLRFPSWPPVAAGVGCCLAEWMSPQRWFASHLGPLRSGAVLAGLLRDRDPRLRRVHLGYSVAAPVPVAAG